MGMWIHVYCRSAAPLTCGAVMDHIREGCFFDDEPTFSIGVVGANGERVELVNEAIDREDTTWSLEVSYGAGHRPVQLDFGPADDATFVTIAEALEEHMPEEPGPHVTAIAERLKDTRQELIMHFSSAVTDECWEMMDRLEAFVAHTYDGLILADEGFFSPELELLWDFDDED